MIFCRLQIQSRPFECKENIIQAEAEVVPSSSLVEVEVGVVVEVEFEVGVEVWVEVGDEV